MLPFLLLSFVCFACGTCDLKSMGVSSVVLPTDAAYATSVHQYASSTVGVFSFGPSAVAFCASEAEVQNAVLFASRCNFTLSTRSGGHSYAACSSCGRGCIQIDVTKMASISISGTTVTIGPGTQLGVLAATMATNGMAIPHGVCRTVRAGGHFQSSAGGHLSTSHGSGMDRILYFRIVLANGKAITVSSTDRNNTLYHSILGSAPGSWGVVTQYTIQAIRNSECPHSRLILVQWGYNNATLLKVMQTTQAMLQEQERRNLRDWDITWAIGPLPDLPFLDNSISLIIVWTGIDSGDLSSSLYNVYFKPLADLKPRIMTNTPLSLGAIMLSQTVEWSNRGYYYHFQSFHSDHWWSNDFFQSIVHEIDRRIAVPNSYISFQFLPRGLNTQWAKNAAKNSLNWRNVRQYVDDWWMYKSPSQAESIRSSMASFRASTKKYWQNADGAERYTWMSPLTIDPQATNLKNPATLKAFFTDPNTLAQMKALKRELDPYPLFAAPSTVPPN